VVVSRSGRLCLGTVRLVGVPVPVVVPLLRGTLLCGALLVVVLVVVLVRLAHLHALPLILDLLLFLVFLVAGLLLVLIPTTPFASATSLVRGRIPVIRSAAGCVVRNTQGTFRPLAWTKSNNMREVPSALSAARARAAHRRSSTVVSLILLLIVLQAELFVLFVCESLRG